MQQSDKPLIDISEEDWLIVKSILKKNIPNLEVRAYGSRTRRTARRYSDLDLVVMTDVPLSWEVRADITNDFSESDLPWKVDVAEWVNLSPEFQGAIAEDLVLVLQGG
jgi:type I restriction enzyme S subunit